MIISVITTNSAYSQVEVKKSTEKVWNNGKLAYAHIVIKGQTLYSICRVYGVTQEEVIAINRKASSSLKAGSVLLIPIKDETTIEQPTNEPAKEKEKKETHNEITAPAKEKGGKETKQEEVRETLVVKTEKGDKERESAAEKFARRAKKHKTENTEPQKDSIEKKEVVKEKKESQKEKNKKRRKNKEEAIQEVVKDTTITHKVKWYEDLDDISSEYQIKKEILIFYNKLPSESLNKITFLEIPIGSTLNRVKKEYKQNLNNPNTVREDRTSEKEKLESYRDINNEYIDIPDWNRINKTPKNVSLILPLDSKGKVNTNYFDFYSGALMACKKIKAEGGDITLNIIDENSYNSPSELITKNNLKESDFIIGPVVSTHLKDYIEFSTENGIPIISPLDPSASSLIENSPYLFQIPTATETQNKLQAEWVKKVYETYQNPLITVIWQDDPIEQQLAYSTMELLDSLGLRYHKISYAILEGKTIAPTFKEYILPQNDNIVIIPSYNEAFVADALRNINILSLGEDRVTLFGNSKWRNFEASDIKFFFDYNLHLVMPYYVDLSKDEVKNFIREYRALFNSEPTANAFSGYDITTFFYECSLKNLKAYMNKLDFVEYNKQLYIYKSLEDSILRGTLLQQSFRLKKENPLNGFSNNASFGIIYNSNFTVTSIEL